MLGDFLDANNIKQTDLAEEMSKAKPTQVDKAQVNRWARNPEANLTRDNIDAILAALTRLLGRAVTYEEAFGSPDLPAAVGEE